MRDLKALTFSGGEALKKVKIYLTNAVNEIDSARSKTLRIFSLSWRVTFNPKPVQLEYFGPKLSISFNFDGQYIFLELTTRFHSWIFGNYKFYKVGFGCGFWDHP